MKRLLFLFALTLLGVVQSFAYTAKIDGIYYNFSGDNATVTYLAYPSNSSAYSGDVVIPSTVEYNGTTYNVTSIDSYAFYNCSSLTSIDIPSSVTSIGNSAFYNCSSLTSIEIPSSVTSIGSNAFQNCSSLTSIEIPSSVTSIGNSAFYACSSLTSIEIPSSVTSIGNSAFYYCSSLTSIEIPSSVTSIGAGAFCGCGNLASINISDPAAWCSITGLDGLMSFGASFKTLLINGVEAENLVIPEGPTTIPYQAFHGFKNIKSVSIPSSVTSIVNNAFEYCSSLTSVEIPSSVTSIGSNAFWHCSSLTSIEIPSSMTLISREAFRGCSSLASVTIPSSVTSIGSSAFADCPRLTSINISDPAAWCSITGLDGLMSFGASFKTLLINGVEAENLVIPEGPTTIPYQAFQYFKNIKSVSIPSSVTSIGSSAFYGCSSLSSVTIPSSVTSIGSSAFYDCLELAVINIADPAAWCKIPGLSGLMSYGSKSKTLLINGEEAEDVVISEGPTTIPNYAFRYFTNIKRVTIPSSVASIGSYAFSGCSSLSDIHFASVTPSSTASSCFTNYVSLVVPATAYDTYVAAWEPYKLQITKDDQFERIVTIRANSSQSALHVAVGEENLQHVVRLKVSGSINGYDIMVMRNKMVNLRHLDLSEATVEGCDYEYYTGKHAEADTFGDYAFYNLSNLFSVKLPQVKTVGAYAFASCANLQKVVLPEGLDKIDVRAFNECKSLNDIVLPQSITSIGQYAFYYCSSLTSIEIPGGITSISSYTFQRCGSLAKVVLNEGLESIGYQAFKGCSIKEIRFPESLITIGNEAFNRDYYSFKGYSSADNQFEEINLPPNLNTIGQDAFKYCTKLKVVRLNPMLKNIADNAFNGCNALKKVYTYTIEPTDILQDTFSAYKSADLYVPIPSYYTYWYNTQWSQFLTVNKTDEEYDFKSFYINKDYTMDDNTGIIGGDPDAELNENSGLINNGSETQKLGTVTIRFNGNNGSASIIANGNLTAEKIKVEIDVTGNKWHFFCFPFDVPLSGVSTSGNKAYVFRHYNAAKRATGASGWEDLAEGQDHLIAGEGYIFQANGKTTLTVEVDNKTTFVGENVATALHVQDAENVANASWNFKGNPGYAYFDIDELGFSAPITVWDPNTNSYVALRPGDDDAFLHPFQAFFVQKPEGTDALTFNAEDRTTYLESQKTMEAKTASRRRAQANVANNPRKLINLSVTDGTNTDKTRVVFNDEKSMAYEMDCDAAKFAAAGVPQLYSIGNDNTHYAINERPNGDGTVRLGFTADKNGRFSIEAQRMDTPCYLRDLDMNTTHDLSLGAYEFDSQKGTFEGRFLLVNTIVAEGIETIELDSITADAVIYDLQGRRIQRAERGVFVVNGKKVNVK